MSDHHKPDPSVPETQRLVRVFVSSTFRDMHAERDELVKFVFPELRKMCRERQVEFVEVDLRWGITEEESKQGRVLPICLEEIKRCKPYFIGLLGERYGWVPDAIPQELIEKESWLREHLGKTGKSVTELEILHGVLNNPEMAQHAFFYFRDPAYIKTIPSDKQKDFATEGTEDTEKLHRLKEEIRKKNLPVFENYPNPKKLGELVLKDLWDVIDKKFPLDKVPTALERERMDHEAFAAARQKVYIGRDAYFKRLDEHVASKNPPLVILGESGSGKSALIANWVEGYKKTHPGDFMVTHFIGGTADSADYVKILRRIMGEIRDRYEPTNPPASPFEKGGREGDLDKGVRSLGREKEDEIPTDPKKVVEQFPVWMAKASAKGRFILVLDALNQLEDRDNAPDLGWLPGFFPENVRVILSTLPGRSLDAITKRGWQTVQVELLTPDERRKLIEEYLARFARRLSQKNMDKIVAARQTSNPLYLKALLDELRVFGIHEELDRKIDDYLTAKTVDDLYEKVLERLERDYERERRGLVSEAMSLIWASRRGLSEPEILELLGKDKEPMPRAYWSPLYLAAEESLVIRSGFLNFFHDYLRKAVEDKYFKDKESKHTAHVRLANYFDRKELDERKADELPWQLKEAQEWERLKDCIADIPMFLRLMTDATQYELMGYWLAMGERFDMVNAYNTALSRYEQTRPSQDRVSFTLNEVARFLELNARYAGAEPLYRRALDIREKVLGQEHPDTATSLNNLAGLLRSKGDYAGAEPLYRRALTIREKALGKEHPDTIAARFNLAQLLRDKGDHKGAAPLYKQLIELYEVLLKKDVPILPQILNMFATGSNNLAFHTLVPERNWKDAEYHYHKAIEIFNKVPDPIQATNSEMNLQTLYHLSGQQVDVERVKELTKILEKAGDKRAEKGHKILNGIE